MGLGGWLQGSFGEISYEPDQNELRILGLKRLERLRYAPLVAQEASDRSGLRGCVTRHSSHKNPTGAGCVTRLPGRGVTFARLVQAAVRACLVGGSPKSWAGFVDSSG